MELQPKLGVIGGSGLYNMPGLQNAQEIEVSTPFGQPSAPLVVGLLQDTPVAFLARHGKGHHISPSEINYRANIYALKSLGVERVVSISACGSLREDYAPGDMVVPDQIFDYTKDRQRTFFGDGLVAHIGVADPFCAGLSRQVADAARQAGAKLHQGGTFITIEGPRFSTRGESDVFRAWGMSIIGMTASPEAFLAREAELCYSVLAHVTDYDCWRVSEEPVSVETVIAVLNQNTHLAQNAVANLARSLQAGSSAAERQCGCSSALATALITDPRRIPSEVRQRLSLLVGKYLK